MVLELDASELGETLVWEPSRGGDLFPHLYGVLDPARVKATHEAPLDGDGVPRLEGLT